MAVVSRYWLVPDTMYAAAMAQAEVEQISLAEWVRLALSAWVEDLPMVRLTTPDLDEDVPAVALPPSAVENLRKLSRDPSPRRLNLWLALLAEAHWPVPSTVAPVLGSSTTAVGARVQAGQKVLATAEDLDVLLSRIPPIPDAPDVAYKALPGEKTVGLSVRLDTDLFDQVAEKAARERVSNSYAVRTAIRERLALLGLEPDGSPLLI